MEDMTGYKFTKDNFIHSPFKSIDKTPSCKIFFNSNLGKMMFKDFSTGEYGDAIDFIMKYKNVSYDDARRMAGIEVAKTPVEEYEDKIREYVNYQVTKGNKKGYKPLGVFVFVDKYNNPIYAKVKFLKPDGKKETPYYHIENGKVVNNRGCDEVPYNYYNLLNGIANKKTLVFVEGEKDVNSLSHLLSIRDYVVSSLKGFKDYDKIKTEFMNVFVIGDTGTAGEKYINDIKYNFIGCCSDFRIINLPNLRDMGDNKDVTDWLEDGHSKTELLNAFRRSLNLNDQKELQQDGNGIYKTKFKKDDEGENKPTRVYISDFNILSASRINKVDVESNGIKLTIKSCIDGKVVEKIGSSKIFDDLRSFRNFLGMDFTFSGANVGELVRLKMWVNKYFTIENKDIYIGTKFIQNGDEFELITPDGAITPKRVNYNKISESIKVNCLDVHPIGKEELQELMRYLFSFYDKYKTYSILGSVFSFLQIGQNIATDNKLHHLLIVGESNSGKSAVLEQIIAPLLNMPLEERKAMSTSPFALQKLLSSGNYPIILDEFKPSMMDRYKIQKISDIFRTSYDRQSVSRGDKSFNIKEFYLNRPLIIAGEESYPNGEKANITRSCIVYISQSDKNQSTFKAISYLKDHKELLNKLGKSLILEVLNMPPDEYKSLRTSLRDKFNLKDRVLNTAVNIACGLELLNKVLIKNDLQPIGDYVGYVESNLKEEVLNNGEDSYSVVEQMLLCYNDMMQNASIFISPNSIKFGRDNDMYRRGKIYIRTQLLVDSIHKYCKDTGSIDLIPLKTNDFKKQAAKSGYLIKKSAEVFNIETGFGPGLEKRAARFDEYDKEKLSKLGLNAIVDCDDELENAVCNIETKCISNVIELEQNKLPF